MAIEAEPLITRSLEPLENRVEVLFAESRLGHRSYSVSSNIEEVHLMTLLVSFDPQPAQRHAARALAGTFIAAQSMFKQLPAGRNLSDWLTELLEGHVSASLCIVFSLPDFSKDIETDINSILANIRNTHHHLQLAVAVSMAPADWIGCRAIDGFVMGEVNQKNSTAIHVFNLLASLMAPGMSACVDAEDLRGLFGPSDRPSQIASGVWLAERGVYFPANETDAGRLKKATAIAFIPAIPLRFASQHALLSSLRSNSTEDAEFVMMAPYGLTSDFSMNDQIVPVMILMVM